MPSPFPGMDPYLEDPDLWPGFHNRLMTYVCDELQAELPSNYVATLEMRIYLEELSAESDRAQSRVPDIDLVRTTPSPGWQSGSRQATVPLRGIAVLLDPLEVREAFIVVRSVPGGELVTGMELLSPSNKRNGRGRQLYLAKQNELVQAGANLVEIDLLRSGQHTVLAPASKLAELKAFHYLASVYRVSHALECDVFPWTVREGIPALPVPLAVEDQEVVLDLQPLLNRAYANGAFGKLLRYRSDADPPLTGADAEWADGLLRDAGLRGEPLA